MITSSRTPQTAPQARLDQAPELAGDRAVWREPWLWASATLISLVILERWLLSFQRFSFDVWASSVGMSHKPWPIWDITRVYQQVGRPLVAIGEVLVMIAWLWFSSGGGARGRRALGGLVIALCASLTNGVIKIVCGPTPLWHSLPHHVGTNFPSGVVTFMTASVGYVALVGWRQGHRTVPRLLALAILGAGPARVVGGQHLITDVIGAYMLGTAGLLAARAHLLRGVPRGRRPGGRKPGGERRPGPRQKTETIEEDLAWNTASSEALA